MVRRASVRAIRSSYRFGMWRNPESVGARRWGGAAVSARFFPRRRPPPAAGWAGRPDGLYPLTVTAAGPDRRSDDDGPVHGPSRSAWAVHGVLGAALATRALLGHLTLPLLVVAEGTGFLPLLLARPSEATLVVGGVQARSGLITWPALVVLAVAGAVASDTLSYAAGRVWGERALRRVAGPAHRDHHGSRVGRVIAWSQRLMARSAPAAVALGRPTVVTHGVTPVLAGTSGVRLPVFLAASTAGALAWVGLWVAGGAALGALWQQSKAFVIVAAAVAAAAAVAVGGWAWCRRSPRCALSPT